MERLIAAAINFYYEETDTWLIFTGVRHSDIYEQLNQLKIKYDRVKFCVEGFLTNKGEFVDRYNAKVIALNANQLIVPEEETYGELYTEDVW